MNEWCFCKEYLLTRLLDLSQQVGKLTRWFLQFMRPVSGTLGYAKSTHSNFPWYTRPSNPSNSSTRPVSASRQPNKMVFAIYAACPRFTWGTPRVHIPISLDICHFNINIIVDGALLWVALWCFFKECTDWEFHLRSKMLIKTWLAF